jgi:sulfate permease, SulP family
VWRASRPHISVVGRVPGTQHFRNIERHRVETRPELLLIRVDENLFFGNADAVRDHINAQLTLYTEVRHLVLVMSSVSLIDATALDMLVELMRDLSDAGIRLHLAEVKGPVLDVLADTAFLRDFGGRGFLSTEDAFRTLSGK